VRSCRGLCTSRSRGRSFQPFDGMGEESVDRFDLIADRIRCDSVSQSDVFPRPSKMTGLEGPWEVVELN